MEIKISRTNGTPIYLQIKNHFKEHILTGELLKGFRLPSVRALSGTLEVHRNTVIKAYQLLAQEEFIAAKSHQYYEVIFEPQTVSYGTVPLQPLSATTRAPMLHWESLLNDPYLEPAHLFDSLVQKSMSGNYISFAGDFSYHADAPQIVQTLLLEASSHSVLQDGFGYAPTSGLLSLRKNICGFLRKRHIHTSPGEVHIFSESTQTLNYLIKLFLSPGDYVVMEEPFYTDVYHMLTENGARVVTVPQDQHGMNTDILEVVAAKYRPKMIYTLPTFNNPTRSVLSLERRYALLDVSTRYQIPVVEEETCYDLRFEGSSIPPVKALDTHGHVIYLDSFTDTFAPGIRVSYAVAPKPVTEKFKYLFTHDGMQMDTVSQLIMSEFLSRGHYYKNVKKITEVLRKKRSLMLAELHKASDIPITFSCPAGGLGIWCRVPDCINLAKLQKEMEKQRILFMPGFLFYGKMAKSENFIRLNFGYPSEDDIKKGMPVLIEGIRKHARQ